MDAKQSKKSIFPTPLQSVGASVPIPYSEESERAVNGGWLTNPNALSELLVFLRPEDFFILRNRYVYEAGAALHSRNEAIDYTTVVTELKNSGRLDEIGGAAYLTALVNDCPDSSNVLVYGHLVERAAIRRQLMTYGNEVIKAASDSSQELGDVLNTIEGQQIDIAARYTGTSTHTMQAAVSAFYDHVEALVNNPQALAGLSTGFREVDKMLGGLVPGRSMILAARPGMGKTSMMLGMALNLAKAGHRVAFFSMEMSADELIGRLAAMESGIPATRMSNGDLSAEEWGRFVKASGVISQLPIFIDDSTTWTPLQLTAKCASLQRRYGIEAVFVDYLGQMSGGGRYKDNKTAEVGHISRSLKAMARNLRLPVMTAAQLSRKCEDRADKRPVMSDLRDSGEIEADADAVILLYRDEVYNEATECPNQVDVIFGKNRHGATGTVYLYFEKTLTKFMNAENRHISLE